MHNEIEITRYDDERIDAYVRLTGAQLRRKTEEENGIFIAESPTVIEVALQGGCVPLSLLCDRRLLNSKAERVIGLCEERTPGIPVYFAERDLLTKMTGFELTRGMLCAFRRPALPDLDTLLRGASRVAILEGVVDSTNIGAIFRSAAALGVDAVLLTPTCCDPLCRRAVRVSMGTVFLVPWGYVTEAGEWPRPVLDRLHAQGFHSVALALTDRSLSMDDPALHTYDKVAYILGTEGDGLHADTIAAASDTVKIPMLHGVDSLNVASAAAVAFWELRKR